MGPVSSPSRKGLRAILLDAFGTLVAMDPPGPRLRGELARAGIDVEADAAEAAFRSEIAFYIAHHLEGRDEGSLHALRDRCAAVIARELGLVPGARPAVRAAMLASLRFEAQPDAAPALSALRARGFALVVASNWDCSLPRVLEDAGLDSMVDGVVASATVGAAKPDPVLFEAALAAAGARPDEALHVGDSLAHDVAGARAADVAAVLLDRAGDSECAGVATIRSLAELPSLVLADR